MLIGVISDTHDAILEVKNAIKFFKAKKVGAIIHAGDFTSQATASEFLSSGIPFFAVLGNMDPRKMGPADISHGVIKEPPYYLMLDNRSILIAHDEKNFDIAKESALKILNALQDAEKELLYLRRPPESYKRHEVAKDW